MGEGYTSVVGTTGNDSRGVGSFVYQNGRDGGWVSLNSSNDSWNSFETQADALKNFEGQCANCQALANSVAENAETKGKVVGGLAVGAVLAGTGAGVVMAATGTAAGGAVITLGLTEATGAATTVATAAVANPDKTAQVGTQLSAGAQKIYDLMGGPNATGKLNKAGDLVVMSEDKLTKFRVDLKNPGNDLPHMHLEQFINGKWRDAISGVHRIYPQP